MCENNSILFFLRNHNEIDQMTPVLYTLGERNNIDVDIILDSVDLINDYRINLIIDYKNMSIVHPNGEPDSNRLSKKPLMYYLKKFGRQIPLEGLDKIYNTVSNSSGLSMPDDIDYRNYSVVAFDWSMGKSKQSEHLANRNDLTTIVFPHGDSPFINRLETQKVFERFIQTDSHFIRKSNSSKIGYENYDKMLKHDYILFPNMKTAGRIKGFRHNKKVNVLGSPRYNQQWLDILTAIRPTVELPVDNGLNIVLFLRIKEFFISKREVINTLLLLNKFESINVIVKEHPRDQLIKSSEADDLDNIKIVSNEIDSTALIDWGDAFLSLGTTITFEPIMRKKPVLALEYSHANHSIVSHYFPNSDMRSKEDLYYTIHDILNDKYIKFYQDKNHQKFTEEMITNSNESVLGSWADFIEECVNEG